MVRRKLDRRFRPQLEVLERIDAPSDPLGFGSLPVAEALADAPLPTMLGKQDSARHEAPAPFGSHVLAYPKQAPTPAIVVSSAPAKSQRQADPPKSVSSPADNNTSLVSFTTGTINSGLQGTISRSQVQLGSQATNSQDLQSASRAVGSAGQITNTAQQPARRSDEGARPPKKSKGEHPKPTKPKPGSPVGARDSQAPTVTIYQNPAYGVEWQAVLVSGNFHDQGDTGAHTLTINWGDGQSQQQYYSFLPPMGQGFGFQHTYEDDAVYTVAVTVVDVANNVGQAQVAANIGTVEKVEWIAMDSPLDGNPKEGGGQRIYPDKVTPNDMLNRQKVKIRATLTQPAVGVTIWVQERDVDDPSADQGPVDFEIQVQDNRGGGGRMGTGQTFLQNGKAVAEYELTVSMQPGDNYRAVATVKPGALDTVSARQDDTDKARVFDDVTGQPLPSDKVKVTDQLLTVWRRLHVEVDSMGLVEGNPPFTGFDPFDDFLTNGQDVPMPVTDDLVEAMKDAYVTVLFDVGDNNNNVQFDLNVEANESPDDWDSRVDNGPHFWVAYVLGSFQGADLKDNDPDTEANPTLGETGNPNGVSWIYLETIRDAAREYGYEYALVERDVVVHEVGHAVANNHSNRSPSPNWRSCAGVDFLT